MSLLQTLIAEKLSGSGGGGGSVTVDAALSATSENPVQNKEIAAALENKADKEATVTVSGTTPTITPAPNTIYNCGELTSLTIINPTATGAYSIVFTSGSTPTDLSIDPAIKMPDGFSVEANRIYEINVLANRAVVGSWAVSA
ncbi:MAG: hypothetical protein IJK69_05600 [Oscillospiraceae bacterium]|nr:hypothetical protein [Oscillospiraceae bacterium]